MRAKVLSLCLSLVLIVGMCPAPAFADEGLPAGVFAGANQVGTCFSSEPTGGGARHGKSNVVPRKTPALTIHGANYRDETGLRTQTSIPSKYDARTEGHVTPVRDQGSFGTCWAVSIISSIESSMLAHGQATNADALDLSDRHLAYFTYHAASDPLGNTSGDSTTVEPGYASYLEMGGNEFMSSCTLASWQGTVEESVAPYSVLESEYAAYGDSSTFYSRTDLDSSIAYAKDNMHLENIIQIPTVDRDDVKQAIMDYGAVSTSVNSNYFNSAFTALYSDDAHEAPDHVVTIVGWDDSYSRDNFGDSDWDWFFWRGLPQPSSDGAWLVKNSWGRDSGEDGYFWLSYEDAVLNSSYSRAYAFDVGLASNFDHIYQYDGTSFDGCLTYSSGCSIANEFTAKGNAAPGGGESLKAVSFALEDVNVDYSVQVYLDPSSSDPTSGFAMLASPVVGRTSYAGYYTVDLPDPVLIPNGALYSVVVTLSHQDGSPVSFCVDASDEWYGVTFTNHVEAGQSFARDSSVDEWEDLAIGAWEEGLLYGGGYSARLKAFTNDVSASDFSAAMGRKLEGVVFKDETVVYDGAIHSLEAGGLPTAVTVEYQGNDQREAGVYAVTAMLSYGGSQVANKRATLTISKAAQKLTVAKKQKKKTVKFSKVKRKARYTSKVKVKGAEGKVTFKKKSGSKKLTIKKKTGKIKVKKGTKKGTYKIKAKIKAAGTANYEAAAKTVKIKVRVK